MLADRDWDAHTRKTMSRSAMRWIKRAGRIAAVAYDGQHALGAVVVRGGSVLSVGANRPRQKLHPDVVRHIPHDAWSYCAEEVALRQIVDGKGATLYVARVTPGGNYGLAKPCEKCQSLIKEKNISKVVYTTRDMDTGEWGMRTLRSA